MKNLVLFSFIAALFFVSCHEEVLPTSFSYDLEEDFQVGGIYLSGDNILKFKITEINDSRCPSDVVCVWQGTAIVKIEVETPLPGKIELSTYNNLIDTVGSYSFQLVEVSPYPVSTKVIKTEEYDVKLKIKKLP